MQVDYLHSIPINMTGRPGEGVSMTGQGRRPVTTLGSCLIHLLIRELWESMEHTYLEPSYPGRMGLGDLYDHSHQMVAQAAQPESGKVRNRGSLTSGSHNLTTMLFLGKCSVHPQQRFPPIFPFGRVTGEPKLSVQGPHGPVSIFPAFCQHHSGRAWGWVEDQASD